MYEWVDSLRDRYSSVERYGGPGDMGIDIAGFIDGPDNDWDNYQCKHYDHALRPTDVWVELGKLAYYTYKLEFDWPRKYYFVAPYGAGTRLYKLLRDPEKLREGLINNWDQYCASKISGITDIRLVGPLEDHVRTADFGIFAAISPLVLPDSQMGSIR